MDKQLMRYYVVDFGKYNNEITMKLKEYGCNIHKLINKKSKLSESIEMIKDFEMQKEVCKLVGKKAKFKGKKKKWWRDQTLYWNGKEYKRDSQEYQELLDRAYDALSKNEGFRKALLATGDSVLTHSIGKSKINETILTKQEFCSRLMNIRERLKN